MKKAITSPNRLHVEINRNFVVKVWDENKKDWNLTTARKLNNFIQSPELTEKLFYKALNDGKYLYIFKIRNRLKIKFSSK